jgi:hypothetical protein
VRKTAAEPQPAPPTLESLIADIGEWATTRQIPPDRIERDAERFLDYCEANNKRYDSYPAAFRNWLTSPFNDQPVPPNGSGGGIRQKPTARENVAEAMRLIDERESGFDRPKIDFIDATYRVARVGK